MGTETFNYTVTFGNGAFEIVSTATTPNLIVETPVSDAKFVTHPTNVALFYLGKNTPILLDYTKCTNQAPSSRQNLIEILQALATLGSVTVSGGTLTTVGTVNAVTSITNPVTIASLPYPLGIGPAFGLSFSVAGSQNVVAVRVNPTSTGNYMVLQALITTTSAALSSGQLVTINYNPTVNGGAWATPASVSTSIVQTNTTFTSIVGGNTMWVGSFNNPGMNFSLSSLAFKILTGIPFVINYAQSGIGSSTLSLNWVENV